MNFSAPDSPRANRILGTLPLNDYLRLSPHLEAVHLLAGQVLEAPMLSITHVHFPVSCAATLLSTTRDGELSELALTGREGLIGLPALLGNAPLGIQAVVLTAGLAYRLPTSVFFATLQSSASLQSLCLRYVQNLMLQMAQGVTCSLHHSVLQRLSSWLLYHRAVTESDQVRATHETIAHMLGVRRESITQAAGQLQANHCLTTSRGCITIDDADALRGHVCECFGLVAEDHRQLWAQPLPPESSAWAQGLADGQAASEDEGVTSHEPRSDTDGRYADIYDFAPVGLLSVDSQGRLVEANLAAAIFLGIQRSQCHQHRFVDFLHDEARVSFEEFHREVLSGRCRRHCDLALKAAAHRAPAVVRLEATVDESGEENRMVMVDVTDAYERFEQLQSRGSERARVVSESMLWWSGAQGAMGPGSAAPNGQALMG